MLAYVNKWKATSLEKLTFRQPTMVSSDWPWLINTETAILLTMPKSLSSSDIFENSCFRMRDVPVTGTKSCIKIITNY